MQKFLIRISITLVILIFINIEISNAGVRHILDSNRETSQQSAPAVSNKTKCIERGYSKRDCSDGKIKDGQCPHDNSLFKNCICKKEYKYSSSNCLKPKVLSGQKCDEKYTICQNYCESLGLLSNPVSGKDCRFIDNINGSGIKCYGCRDIANEE